MFKLLDGGSKETWQERLAPRPSYKSLFGYFTLLIGNAVLGIWHSYTYKQGRGVLAIIGISLVFAVLGWRRWRPRKSTHL